MLLWSWRLRLRWLGRTMLCLAAPVVFAENRLEKPPEPCRSEHCLEVKRKIEQRTPAASKARESRIPEDLSVDQAVASALANNSAFQAALADLAVAQADVKFAGMWANPTLQVLFSVGPKPFESLLSLPIENLWQRPRRVAAAKLNLARVGEALVQNGLDVVRDVKVSHADLYLAGERVRVTSASSELRQRIAELTRKRLEAGDISEMEAKLPEIESRSFSELLARSQRDIEIARQRVRTLMGLSADATAFRAVAAPLDTPIPAAWAELREQAFSSRPDLRAAEWNVEAAIQRAGWERSRVLNLLAPLLSVKGVGDAGIRGGPGISAEIPIQNRNQGNISRADAEVQRATLQYAALRDQIELELRQAHEQYVQAGESLQKIRTEILPVVTESIRLAERAYTNGDTSYLSVLESSRQLHDGQIREVEAAAAVRRARAQLERAVGRDL